MFWMTLTSLVIESTLTFLNPLLLNESQLDAFEAELQPDFIGSTFFLNLNFLSEYFGNLILIYFFFMFLKLIFLSSIMELMWPTHFFNKKNLICHTKVRNRLFVEFFLKMYSKSTYLNVLNISVIKLLFN